MDINTKFKSLICFAWYSFLENLIWWVNGVGQLVLGIFGFLANSTSLTILTQKELASTFNYLLVALAVSDNLHYICSLALAIMNLTIGSGSFRGTYFPQFHSIFFMTSFYVFLALVTERLMALSKLRNSTAGTTPRYFYDELVEDFCSSLNKISPKF